MNPGAQANIDRAREIALKIAQWRSEGLEYAEVGKRLGISPAAAKQRLWRYRQHQ
jgi:DNA-directed RNA polymerase specialized sigma24 family protein